MTFFVHPEAELDDIFANVEQVIGEIIEEAPKDEIKRLSHIVKGTQQHFWREYKQYATVEELFRKGHYNCISGTAMLAFLLDRLNYRVTIYETAFHVYILIALDSGLNVLVESTDLTNPVVASPRRIKMKRRDYRRPSDIVHFCERSTFGNSTACIRAHTYERAISLQNLAGLHCYNQAVFYFNRSAYLETRRELQKAHALYSNSARITELRQFLEQVFTSLALSD